MASETTDILAQTGLTPNTNFELGGQIDGDLYNEVQEDLKEEYDIDLSHQEIADIMEAQGIDFGFEAGNTVADLVYDALQEES